MAEGYEKGIHGGREEHPEWSEDYVQRQEEKQEEERGKTDPDLSTSEWYLYARQFEERQIRRNERTADKSSGPPTVQADNRNNVSRQQSEEALTTELNNDRRRREKGKEEQPQLYDPVDGEKYGPEISI